MNTGHKTIVAMLAVVAVLLVVNIVQGPRAAEAQELKGDGDPYVVTHIPFGSRGFLRVWSDAQVGLWLKPSDGPLCDFEFDFIYSLPLDHPAPVVRAEGSGAGEMILVFEDGFTYYISTKYEDPDSARCVLSDGGASPFCLGDVDRDGETNFNDLLFVLNDWGECE